IRRRSSSRTAGSGGRAPAAAYASDARCLRSRRPCVRPAPTGSRSPGPLWKRLEGRRAELPDFLERFGAVELRPEVERHMRFTASWRAEDALDEPQQRGVEVVATQPVDCGQLSVDDPILEI